MYCCNPMHCPAARHSMLVCRSILIAIWERKICWSLLAFCFLVSFIFLGRVPLLLFRVSKKISSISLNIPPISPHKNWGFGFWEHYWFAVFPLVQHVRLCISQILKCKKGALVMIAICCKSFSAMFLAVNWAKVFFEFKGTFKHLKNCLPFFEATTNKKTQKTHGKSQLGLELHLEEHVFWEKEMGAMLL